MSVHDNLAKWYASAESGDQAKLSEILADDVVFLSPVVHTPQEGKYVTSLYLTAASNTIGNDSFKYTGEYGSENGAVIEFETEMDGIKVNGIDMITWNDEGLISEFKVMVRPLKAVNMVHAQMKAMLEEFKAQAGA
jgi:hypothetical protein